MKNTLCAIAAVAGGTALAAEHCTELCNADFYVSATSTDMQQLVEQGVDVNAQDDAGKTALHWIARAKPGVISVLLEAGADVNAVDQLNRSPLHFVAATGSTDNILLLLEAGANVNAKTANDWTPLHGAAKFGPSENVMVLLEAGADPTARTEMQETPFELSSNNQMLDGTEALEILEAATQP